MMNNLACLKEMMQQQMRLFLFPSPDVCSTVLKVDKTDNEQKAEKGLMFENHTYSNLKKYCTNIARSK